MAIGKIFYYEKNQTSVKREKVEDVEAEVTRFNEAKETAKGQLERLFEKAQREVGETEAAIFEVHMMMMDDGDYLDSIYNIIRTQETWRRVCDCSHRGQLRGDVRGDGR